MKKQLYHNIYAPYNLQYGRGGERTGRDGKEGGERGREGEGR